MKTWKSKIYLTLLGLCFAISPVWGASPRGPVHPVPGNIHPQILDYRPTNLSDSPSDGELGKLRLFEEPLVPTNGEIDGNENQDLATALKATMGDFAGDEKLEALGNFIAQHPKSRWVLAVSLNRGLVLTKRGFLGEAKRAFVTAWEAGKTQSGSSSQGREVKGLADRSLGELALLEVRVGDKEKAGNYIEELKGRNPTGAAGRAFEDARGSRWLMDHATAGEPSLSGAGCGPSALQDLLGFGKEQKASSALAGVVPGPKGYSLSQLLDLSDKLMMGLQMAKREQGAEVVIPCVVHWKVGHYSALVEKKTIKGAKGDVVYYRSHDPLFGVEGWVSKKALDEEGSGYYLVGEGNLPTGWEKVEAGEGLRILGRGPITYTPTPTPTCTCQATPACPTCNGMVVASMDMGNVSATMNDTPLHYRPQVGPMMSFSLAYQQKTVDPLPGSNFGPNWNFNWQGYVVYNYGSGTVNYTLVARSGGAVSFRPGGFVPNLNDNILVGSVFDSSHGTALAGLPSSFILEMTDGGAEVYSTAEVGAGSVNILLTQVIDAQGNAVSIEYDNLGRISGIMDAVGQTSAFSYGDDDPANPDSYLVTNITDPFTRNAIFTYTDGQLTAIQDQLGLVSSMTYGTDTNYPGDWVSTLTTPYGTTRFDYTGTGSGIQRELDISDPVGLSEHMRFIEVQPVTDDNTALPQGMIVTNSWLDYRNTFYWDKKAMADAPLSPSSATVYHWLHAGNQPEQALTLESLKKPLEARIWYNYPGQTDPLRDLNITMFQPSITARVLADGSTQATTKTYNSFGNMTLIVDPKGRSVTYIYDTNGIDLLSEKDSQGDVLMAQTYFPGTHNVETRTDAAGQTTHYTYNNAGQVLTMRTPMNETTNYAYDGSGNLLSVTPPQQGAGVTYTYDQLGRVSTQTDAVRGTLTYSYDSMDRVVRVDYPDGTHEITAYYRLDVQSTTDRQGRTTSYTYDGDRRKITMTDPKQQTTNYGWCACGSMTSLQDPKGNTTRWTYDLEGRVVQKTYPDTSSYTYLYDPAVNRLILMTDAKRQETQYSYDEDDKLIGVNYIGGLNNTPPVAYQYDQDLGRLTNMEDGTGSTGYSYYPIGGAQLGGGRIHTVTQPVGSTTSTISYTYDADGRITSKAIDGATESYGFNGVGQLTQVQNPLGSFGYTYDPASARLTQVTYPNGQQTNMDYFTPSNPLGASGSLKDLTNLGGGTTSGQTLSKFSYAYNPTGEINTWQQQLDNNSSDAKTYGMGYDADSELQGVTLTSGTSGFDGLTANQSVTYGYDAAGNRTVEKTPNFLHTFGTNNLNQLNSETDNPISVVGSTNRPASVLVNATPVPENTNNQFQTSIPPIAGSSTPLTVLSVASDGTVATTRNHVLNAVPIQFDANGNCVKDSRFSYSWDAANRLIGISSINATPATVTDIIQMTYDGYGRRVGIVESHGSTVLTSKTFVWNGAQLCQERDSTGHTVTKQFFGYGEQINGTNYFFTRDRLRSVREMTDSNGTVQANYDYDPWGRQTVLSQAVTADFGYAGYYVNKTTGLDLTWYRAYDPEKGRWLSRDPLGEYVKFNLNLPTGPDLYAYAKNNPVNQIDPLGLACCNPGGNPELKKCLDDAWNDLKNNLLIYAIITGDSQGLLLAGCGLSVPGAPVCITAVELVLLGPELVEVFAEYSYYKNEVANCNKRYKCQ